MQNTIVRTRTCFRKFPMLLRCQRDQETWLLGRILGLLLYYVSLHMRLLSTCGWMLNWSLVKILCSSCTTSYSHSMACWVGFMRSCQQDPFVDFLRGEMQQGRFIPRRNLPMKTRPLRKQELEVYFDILGCEPFFRWPM